MDAKPVYPTHKNVEKTFYLVGDAGLSPMGGMSDALATFKEFLETEQTSGNYTIFLGDNIYPAGMDPKDHPRRKQSENMIDAQYKAVKDYDGQTIFLPGNHEWYNDGVLGVAREEAYVESKFPGQDAFKPSNACPLESLNVSENIQLIIIDTQWFLEDWNKNPSINQKCDIKTREKFFIDLKLELEKNQNKTIVFAMHHPMFTNGNHGGYFALEKHLYPFQKKIPLPILSSLVVQIRSQGGVSVQDRYNELYNNFMNKLQELAKHNQRLVFVSGHDHNLQYIEKDGFSQIVSGAGSKESYAATGKDGFFSTGAQGFAVLDVFKDGSSWVRYYVKGEGFKPDLIFQKEVIPAPKHLDVSQYPKTFPKQYTTSIYKQDSISQALFFNTVWGAKYKNAYAQPVKAKTATLDTLYGGLKVVNENKAADYNSLLLTDKKGKRYSMRPMGKKALQVSRQLVFEDNTNEPSKTESTEIPTIKGQEFNFYTATHPYAVLAIPEMARALDIFYTQPRLYYVPKQKSLGNYNETYGNELYLISEEPSEKSEGEGFFNYPDEVQTTDDILIELRKTGNVFVDEENYIKSRLFDMLIGNWDRGQDHWRWAEFKDGGNTHAYVPIPTNRDNAFSSFEGNILDVTRSLFSGTKQSHVYGEDLNDLKWFNKEGIVLDRALLANSGREQWKYLARILQDRITDAVIESAFNAIPEAVQDEALEDIKQKLKARKANLVEIADSYFTYLSTLQTIVGTDYNDRFEITRLPDGKTQVRSFNTINGIASDTLIDRTFSSKDTREVWVYGLSGSDTFVVDGTENDLIYIRLIGGQDSDVYNLNQGRRVKVYDFEKKTDSILNGNRRNFRFTNVYSLNAYDYRKQIEHSQGIVSAIGYNPDDGFRAAVQYVYSVDGYQRNPFSQKHSFNAAYFSDRNSFEIGYSGEFANIINNLNLNVGGRFTSPNFTRNFFGYGNETKNFQAERGYRYNRIEVQQISANVGLLRNSNFGSFFKLQASFDAFKANKLPNNFISDTNIWSTDQSVYYGTLEGVYNYRSYDNTIDPSIGMMFDLNAGITDNLERMDEVFGFIKTRIGFYNALVNSKKLILKTNLSYEVNLGENYQFYQAPSLGGDNGLRGYREQRFTGKSYLVGSADLRYSLPSFNIGLRPFKMGVYAGADLGRVWLRQNVSEKWHNSYGGGFWIHGVGGLNANVSMFSSKESNRFVFGLGFDF